jgi:sigma-B regulation protein RsbU (phosphoserine phosphatase)
MMKFITSIKILIPVLFILFGISFSYDLLKYYSPVDIPLLDRISEFSMLIFAIIYYYFIQKEFHFHTKSIQESVKSFILLLGALYFSVIITKLILNPSYSPVSFPQLPETLSSVIYSNIITLLAICCMTPMLILLKNFIYYKRKKRTIILMRLFFVFLLICIILTVITRAPLNFNFSGYGIYNNIVLVILIIIIFLLSFRHSWITYLSRKEKVSYYFTSLFLIWAVLYLYDFAFKIALPAHSLAISVYANICWYFFDFYVISCSIYLLIQLPTARVFDRKMKEVSSLHKLARAISSEFDFNKIVKSITDMTSEVIESEINWLELFDYNSNEFYIASTHNLKTEKLAELKKEGFREIHDQILRTEKPIIINEFTKNHPFVYIKKWKPDIGSMIGVPLISSNGNTLGILFAAKSHSFGFDPDDMAMLEAYANQAVIALDNAYLLKNSLERERLEEELRIARNVQQRLLPQEIPKFKNIHIESLTITAYEVGGDYYDFLSLPDNHIGFIIGDVSGKGTSAAFYMAEAKGIIQSLSKTYRSPKEILIHANEILYGSLERKSFITLLMASIDRKNKKIHLARAGHCPLIHYRSSEKRAYLLQSEGIGIGLDKGPIFHHTLKEESFSYHKNDIFTFYTDGLSEARNKNNEEFGEQRLCDMICQNANQSVTNLKETILDSFLSFLNGKNLEDDLTLLLVKT